MSRDRCQLCRATSHCRGHYKDGTRLVALCDPTIDSVGVFVLVTTLSVVIQRDDGGIVGGAAGRGDGGAGQGDAECSRVRDLVVVDLQPEGLEQGARKFHRQLLDVDLRDRQRVDQVRVGGVEDAALKVPESIFELFLVGAEFDPSGVDVADVVLVRFVDELEVPDDPLDLDVGVGDGASEGHDLIFAFPLRSREPYRNRGRRCSRCGCPAWDRRSR